MPASKADARISQALGRKLTAPRTLKNIVAGTLLSGGVAVAGVGLTAGSAHAENWCPPNAMVGPVCYGPNQWCPGDSLFQLTQNHVANPINWDMRVCHTYYYVPWAGQCRSRHLGGRQSSGPQTLD
jgi:hypothetical protein